MRHGARKSPNSAHHYEPLLHAVLWLGAFHSARLHPQARYRTDAVKSLTSLTHLLESHAQHRFHAAILETLASLNRSGAEAHSKFTSIFVVLYTMDEPTFQTFIAPRNSATQILLAYFAATLVIMQIFLVYEIPHCLSMYQIFSSIFAWVDSIDSRLPVEFQRHIIWPVHIVNAFTLNYEVFKSDVTGLVRLTLSLANDGCSRSCTPLILRHLFSNVI
ncbi:hypothetical protein ACJ73_06901 [Blastomyces percursus]|uniref:Uncharacterized protein n=1 Tax=Blastomyces percursus TaxID=1658174 RepID=A0A1J9R2B2_9EURO|nr:hypothetical protein ACJ73_06901 [Blastomyces percursus]